MSANSTVDVTALKRYDRRQTYEWNYDHAPEPVDVAVPDVPGDWNFCGLPVDSPLGIPAGPLLNGRWCLYYASLGFDLITYKTVRSRVHPCYDLPNLQPVQCAQISADMVELPATESMQGSWAVSYGMPSKSPDVWRDDVEATRRALPAGKLLSVSVVATVQDGWTIDDLADDYAQCARWAVESGADVVETNFSCPNVSTCDGQLYQKSADAGLVTERVRAAIGDIPYVIKVGHVPTEEQARELVEATMGSVNGIAMTNSIATRVRDGDQLLFDGQHRGICGAAILEASLSQTQLFSQLLRQLDADITVIGVGGISGAEDVRRYLAAGAGSCHVATAAMTNPGLGLQIREELGRAG